MICGTLIRGDMDQETKTIVEQLLRELTGMINAMEKRLEDKIDGFIQQSRESHHAIDTTHQNFRADIKQLYGRIELNEKNVIQVESRVKSIEDQKMSGRWRWEIIVAIGGLLVAAVALFGGSL